jgi:hypothetical protein
MGSFVVSVILNEHFIFEIFFPDFLFFDVFLEQFPQGAKIKWDFFLILKRDLITKNAEN